MILFDRLKASLTKTSRHISAAFASFTGADDEFYDLLEEMLILADFGAQAADIVIESLKDTVLKDGLRGVGEIKAALRVILENKINFTNTALNLNTSPSVILVLGVNGVGKTTTIGKLAARYKLQGKKVLLCAADTFRAAASEQLALWAQRAGTDIIKREEGADPASVIFDAMCAAKSRSSDVVICDTAGRLHNKSNLMSELSKISRIISREMPDADKETLLVLDATTGQNGLVQARQFKDAVDITGIILTKLDGTAKGGVIFSIAQELQIPVKLIGIGEDIDDLVDFNPHEFSKAIFS